MEPNPPKKDFNIDEWEPDEPLWMTKVPEGEKNNALEALNSLIYDEQTPDEIAENFKEQGNACFAKGKKFWKNAIQFYDQAIEQPVKDVKKRSVYFSNRAAVNLQLENHGKVLEDVEESIKLDDCNVKAYFRGAKSAIALKKLELAIQYSTKGLKVEPDNKTLEREKIRATKLLEEQVKNQMLKQQAIGEQNSKKQKLLDSIENKGIVLGGPLFEIQSKEISKIHVDELGKLHFPVLFVYEEYSQLDFIEDFREDTTFGDHLEVMFPDGEFTDWDVHKKYIRADLEVYVVFNQVPPSDPKKRKTDKRARKVKVNHTTQLLKILQHEEYVLPATPIFYIVSAKTTFKNKFLKMSIESLSKLE